jgi:hypothetical protein
MTSRLLIGAYWGDRRETAESCAGRLKRSLGVLGAADVRFENWYRKTGSRPDHPGRPIETSDEALRDLLLAGRNRRDFDGEVIEQLGFSVSVWNGDLERSASVSVFCGAYAGVAGLLNSMVVSAADPLGELSDGVAGTRGRDLALGLAQAWQPDWITVATQDLLDGIARAPREPVVGLVTFLSGRRRVADLSIDGVRAERVPGGTIVVLEREPIDTLSRRARDVAAALRDALGPTPLQAEDGDSRP